MVDALPIPHTSKIDLYCGGQNVKLWFHVAASLDKDKDFFTGIYPNIDDLKFYVNLSNFQIPSTGQYVCKVSLNTFTHDNLLLFNFSKCRSTNSFNAFVT